MLKQGYGEAFFIESAVGIFEWSLDSKGYPYAYGYNMMTGVSFMFSRK